MAPGVGGGPVNAGSISSQAGRLLGSSGAPYTGIPGYTDTVFNPFSVVPTPSQPSNIGQDDGVGAGEDFFRRDPRLVEEMSY